MRERACEQGPSGGFAAPRAHAFDYARVHANDVFFGVVLGDERR